MCIEKNFPRVTVWHQKALPCDVNDHRCMMHVYRKKLPKGYCLASEGFAL